MQATMTMTGNLGTDVDYRGVKEGLGFTTATFRLACTPRIKSRTGDWKDDATTWIRVTCFRHIADNVASSLRRGDPVIVVGKLRTNTWVDKDTGEVQERLVLEAKTVGHDLSRGTTAFKKTERTPEQLDDREDVLAELITGSEAKELRQQEEELQEVTAA